VFGATGVGAAELASYPYWCIEKGYARFVGPREDTAAWRDRANGWIRVLSLDVVASFVVYTFATVAFFLLGAGVLHSLGQTPSGPETIQALSRMYTDILGAWSRPLFLAGAIAVLYSTVFALTAAYSRLVADFLGMLGLYDRRDYRKRLTATRAMTAVFLIVPCFTFYFVREPVVMVKVSGIAQAILLPAMGFGTLFLINRRLPAIIKPAPWVGRALWAASAIMLALVAVSLTLQALRS
jgi:Mn2+/Fe2+ NRAMP family transporter